MNNPIDNSQSKIIAALDKMTFNFRVNFYLFLWINLKIASPLRDYDFKNIPEQVLGFERTRYVPLYLTKKYKEDKDKKYKYQYLYLYEHADGRKIIFKWKYPGSNQASISIEFAPTILINFTRNQMIELFEEFGLNYKHFLVSCMEHSFDCYGDRNKKLKRQISSRSKKLRYIRYVKGKKVPTSDFNKVPDKKNYTTYLGDGENVQVDSYYKEEKGFRFDRVEVTVGRKVYGQKRYLINSLDDLYVRYRSIVEHIFKTFCFIKINQKKIKKAFPKRDMGRWFNRHKDLPEKGKVLLLQEKLKGEFGSTSQFRRKFIKVLPVAEKCKSLLLEYFKNVFFGDIDEGEIQRMRKERMSRSRQRKLELKDKEALDEMVMGVIAAAEKALDIRPLLSAREMVVDQIKTYFKPDMLGRLGRSDGIYRYQGCLNGLVKKLNTSKKKILERIRKKRVRKMKKVLKKGVPVTVTTVDGLTFTLAKGDSGLTIS